MKFWVIQIYVFHRKMSASKKSINDATVQDLTDVRGVGNATASAIISLREAHNGVLTLQNFRSLKLCNAEVIEQYFTFDMDDLTSFDEGDEDLSLHLDRNGQGELQNQLSFGEHVAVTNVSNVFTTVTFTQPLTMTASLTDNMHTQALAPLD